MATRKQFAGAAAATTVSGALTAGSASITIASGTGLPSGATPFVMCIDRGTASEEKVLVTRSGTTLTVTDRGYDATTATSHSDGASIQHVVDAVMLDEANQIASEMTTRGDILYHDGTEAARLAKGTQHKVLRAGANDPEWGYVGVNQLRPSVFLRAASQTINLAYTEISWDTETQDDDGWGTVPGTDLTCPATGVYVIAVEFDSSGQALEPDIQINDNAGSNYTEMVTDAAGYRLTAFSVTWLRSGDVVTVRSRASGSTDSTTAKIALWRVF